MSDRPSARYTPSSLFVKHPIDDVCSDPPSAHGCRALLLRRHLHPLPRRTGFKVGEPKVARVAHVVDFVDCQAECTDGARLRPLGVARLLCATDGPFLTQMLVRVRLLLEI